MENIVLLLIFSGSLLQSCFSRTLDEDIQNADTIMDNSDLEVIYLPSKFAEPLEDNGVTYNFTAFGRSFPLYLKPNYNLVSPSFKLYVDDEEMKNYPKKSCYFLHEDESSVASFDFCNTDEVRGIIFADNTAFEITPLSKTQSYRSTTENEDLQNLFNAPETTPHVVKRTVVTEPLRDENLAYNFDKNVMDKRKLNSRRASRLTLEVAVFFDEAAYKIFSPYLNHNDKSLTDMILAYMNGVQALYHHPSLGTSLEIVIVRLEIMKHQPADFPHYDGERSKLLDSFCAYQQRKNPQGDSNPEHWDMALYVSGLDFFAYENGRKSGVTMGLATVGGVCLEQYACIIAELGTTNVFGKPYPSAGFTSVYILAHEIGHNLGMHHDSSGNSCSKEGYIMSPSRGTNGETQWSTCSAEVMTQIGYAKCLTDKPKIHKQLDHSKFEDTPGQKYTAKKQCEFLLRDRHAVMSPNQKLTEICYNLQCKTPRRSGYYFAGPALEGTECGKNMWCQGGQCVRMTRQRPNKVIPGGWGPWKPGQCHSGCISKSRGYQTRHRECDNPKPVNTDEGCEGSSIDKVLCKDEKICHKRQSTEHYASEKCKEFAKLLPELDPHGSGLQAPHESVRPWMGCAIFCKRKNSGSYYTPRIELNDLGVSPYFPDGTLCHSDSTGHYYCLQNHCLPEHFKLTKTSILHGIGEDVPMPQNAYPSKEVPKEIQSYLSLGPDGKPLQTSILPGQVKPYLDADWETQDYIDLPQGLKQEAVSNDDDGDNEINDEFYM